MITIILCSHYKIFGYLLYIVLGLKNMYYLIRNGLSIIIFLISFNCLFIFFFIINFLLFIKQNFIFIKK